MLKNALLAIICVAGFSCSTTECANSRLHFSLIGFTDQEASNIILRRFEKGNNFQLAKDTAILDINFNRINDTLKVASQIVKMEITSSYDFELYLPLASKTFRITEITEPYAEQRKSIFNNTKELCGKAITSCSINGVNKNIDSNTLYLTK